MINTVLHGDCLELMKDIPDKSIDMILCDLPYGTTACKWDTIIPFEPLWGQYKRIVKDNGAIVLTASQPFTSALVMSNVKMFRYEWIWDKTRGTNFQLANKNPMKSHENILVFYKKLPIYNPQFWYSTPYERKAQESRKNKTTILGDSSASSYRPTTISDGKRFPLSIIREKLHNNSTNLHPTQKPVALFEYLIKTYTNEGDLVLDNCAGSFTTAIAAENSKRNWICMEQLKEYCEIGKKRINENRVRLGILDNSVL